jgi:hypothetical protein
MMDEQVQKIGNRFRRFFWIALPIIFIMICVSVADVFLDLRLGFTRSDIQIVVGILVFGFAIWLAGEIIIIYLKR